MNLNRLFTSFVLVASAATFTFSVSAQSETETVQELGAEAPELDIDSPALEEVITTARALNSSQRLVQERLDEDAVMDILGAEDIGLLGDSTVAAALIRIPGVSLVNNKFIYIRGLGERYSASYLNGARIPSPDLSRNVIPLDIFPTSIVESLQIQKSYSADMPANFGGGSVDVRTKGIPNNFTYSLEIGTGQNSFTGSSALSYAGGSDDDFGVDDGSRALPQELLDGINRYQVRGNFDENSILQTLIAEGNPNATIQDAQQVNRELAVLLNRDINLENKDVHPDISVKGSIGNNFIINDQWEFGGLVGASYDTDWRNRDRVSRNFRFPTELIDTKRESIRSVNMAGNLNLGARFTEDHEILTTTLYLRDTDDETTISDFFNENRQLSDGSGFREIDFKFEERNMVVNQVKATHRFGLDTQDRLPGILAWTKKIIPNDAELTWFYSDAKAITDIPSETSVFAQTTTDPVTGEVLSSEVGVDTNALNYRFTNLDDDVIHHGWKASLPYEIGGNQVDVSFGYEHDQKARVYRQSQFRLGAFSVADPTSLSGPLGEVFSDAEILSPNNDYIFGIAGTNNQSYLAATMTDAVFLNTDWNFDERWRVAAGVRWEDYRQVALGWNPFGYTETSPVLTTDVDTLRTGTFQDDKLYPSLALTYMGDFWAETFQLRLGWSQTTIRPDLREITDASYVDPITDDLVDGNPGVVPADISNLDLRAEWFFGNGDNLTATLFYKDIDNPIEFFESAASDTTIAREIVNADSAEVYGIEIEGLKALGDFGPAFDPFFVRGNVTLQDSELVAGNQADAPTSAVRSLVGASDYVANLTFGFDSPNGAHSAALGYNVFGERLFLAGRNEAPDAFEQPFNSLDFTYSWYPTDRLTLKFKARNILDDKIEIERVGVTVFEREIGQTYSLSAQWGQ